MRKILLILVFVVLAISTVTAQPPTDPRLKGLDTFVTRVLRDFMAHGVTIAVVEKNKPIYTGGFGFRDYEKKLPVTQNTLFAIGSCTKAFTAVILGMLEKEGKLSLDKPVREYLPELKFKNEYTNANVTLRDMMSHRTGLPRHDYSWYGSTASRAELLERIQYQEPTAALREKYQYNNFMYLAQGMVIEKITGKTWEQNMKERILQPLGMNRTNMSVIDMEKTDDHSLAYRLEKNKIIKLIPYRNIDAIAPAGAVNSCAKDMANWLITWINDGKFNGKEIFPFTYRNQAMTIQTATGAGLPGNENPDVHLSGYGFGWGLSSYRGHYRVEHSGGIDGFSTSTSFFPTDSVGIFIVTNQGALSIAIRNFIADRMFKLPPRDWGKSPAVARAKSDSLQAARPNNDSLNRKPNTKPLHDWSDYNGSYENKGYSIIRLFRENDTTWLDYNEAGLRTKSWLQHYHFDVFRIRSTEETQDNKDATKIRFNSDTKGQVSSLEIQMEPAVKDILFEKLPPSYKVEKNELQKYVGEYDFSGMILTVSIRGDNTLMMHVSNQPDYDLVPVHPHEFHVKALQGYSVKFEVNDKNEILGLSFIQPNGTYKAVKKK